MLTSTEALARLAEGNLRYLNRRTPDSDVSPEVRRRTLTEGQHPYAIIVCCSDSRLIPEAIFSAGIGELFVIRVAGNVIDNHQLGSIEYAAEHLGCKLVVVLGHDHCGAVDAALHHSPDGYIKYITNEILSAIGDETDPDRAAELNALHSVRTIEENLDVRRMERENGLSVRAALYRLATGKVDFLV